LIWPAGRRTWRRWRARTARWRGGAELLHPARDLEKLWRDVACDPAELTVVMEPTRNAWMLVAKTADVRAERLRRLSVVQKH